MCAYVYQHCTVIRTNSQISQIKEYNTYKTIHANSGCHFSVMSDDDCKMTWDNSQ